jgi:hypothetical protein
MSRRKKTSVAMFFAREIVGNEQSFDFKRSTGKQGYQLPVEFFEEVADAMIDDPLLGWPDRTTALATLKKQGWL